MLKKWPSTFSYFIISSNIDGGSLRILVDEILSLLSFSSAVKLILSSESISRVI